jgi:RNA polymerase sigma-70 factor (ECF subfamily)
MAIRAPALDLRNPSRFAEVFDEHAAGVHSAALAILRDAARAEDVVQDVFLRLWRRPDAWDPARGPLGAYLRLMARSRALDLWREGDVRERARRRAQDAAVADPAPPTTETPETAALRSAESEALRAALDELSEEQRSAVALAYWGGLTAEQIAERVGIPLGTAKSRIRLGLRRLRAVLAADGGSAAVPSCVAASLTTAAA